ncbi:hypothetical protein T484DRAFT_1781459 [Baffinella frigidus]|nr:hypothetical protein T484DRAFT_1781459 [Cryptophyta sp. CCMP2293]
MVRYIALGVAVLAGTCNAFMPAGPMALAPKASDAKDTKAPVRITGIAKKILLNYDQVIKDGSKPSIVFARVKGEDKWYELGNIASKGDLIAASCLTHKRLILEYAVDFYPSLKSKARELEVGFGESAESVAVLEKGEIPKDLLCGFSPKKKGPAMGNGMYNGKGERNSVSMLKGENESNTSKKKC